MSPTKAIIQEDTLHEAKTGKPITNGFSSRQEIERYVNRRYMVLPVTDNTGRPWMLDGQPIFRLRGTRYETVNDERVDLSTCPTCGGMGVRLEESIVESECRKCTACGKEFGVRLAMMEC